MAITRHKGTNSSPSLRMVHPPVVSYNNIIPTTKTTRTSAGNNNIYRKIIKHKNNKRIIIWIGIILLLGSMMISRLYYFQSDDSFFFFSFLNSNAGNDDTNTRTIITNHGGGKNDDDGYVVWKKEELDSMIVQTSSAKATTTTTTTTTVASSSIIGDKHIMEEEEEKEEKRYHQPVLPLTTTHTNATSTSSSTTSSTTATITPNICIPGRKTTWILFMGDSNMRHTYYWFTKHILSSGSSTKLRHGSTFGLDRTDLNFGGRWGDQEAILMNPIFPDTTNTKTNTAAAAGGAVHGGRGGGGGGGASYPNYNKYKNYKNNKNNNFLQSDTYLRSSMRFLHGSMDQFELDASDWNTARKVRGVFNNKKEQSKKNNVTGAQQQQQQKKNDDDDTRDFDGAAVRPSDYAIWATKNTEILNETNNNNNDDDEFSSWFQSWQAQHPNGKKEAPDIVVLTQGWGDVPGPKHLERTRTVIRSNPSTFFLWAPLYVTNRSPSRYAAMNVTFTWSSSSSSSSSEPNLKVVDLWDLIQEMLPPPSGGGGGDGTKLYHSKTGGAYMKLAFLERMWGQIGCHNNQTNKNQTTNTSS